MRPIVAFMRQEASGGIFLFLSAVLAILLANSPFSSYYFGLIHYPLRLGSWLDIHEPLLLLINDGFMSIFFFLIGLELRHEWHVGALSRRDRRALPFVAAAGGMLIPGLIYALMNAHDGLALRGWAIPTATDIAFALGVLSLLGKRVPVALKVFLTTLAIFDDLGAILIIALFYTAEITRLGLLCALLMILSLSLCRRYHVQRMGIYFLLGGVLWLSVLHSGVHATMAGFLLALFLPLDEDAKDPTRNLKRLETRLHPWVTFGILPLFAFANSGVSFGNLSVSDLWASIPLGIVLGLFLGKQVGILGATWLAIRLRWAKLPRGVRWPGIYGASILCGIGFTMSLFIGGLAFAGLVGPYEVWLRLGVLMGSLMAGALGYWVLYLVYRVKH